MFKFAGAPLETELFSVPARFICPSRFDSDICNKRSTLFQLNHNLMEQICGLKHSVMYYLLL